MKRLLALFLFPALALGQVVQPVSGSGSGTVSPGTAGQVAIYNGTSSVGSVAPSPTTAAAVGAAYQSTYTGLAATRGEVAVSTLAAGTATYTQNCSYHIARSAIASGTLQALWQNFYITSSNIETGVGTSAIYSASMIYPADPTKNCGAVGTEYSATVNGGATATVAALGDALASFTNPAIPAGAGFWIKSQQVNTGGVIFSGIGGAHFSTVAECFNSGTGTPPSFIGSGTSCSPSGGFNAYMPVAVIGQITQPSICIVGDSRPSGIKDTVSDATLDTGEESRFIGPYYGYTKIAVASTTAATALTNFTNRLRILTYCSHVLDEYGVNDAAVVSTPATVATARTNLAALFGKPTIGVTLPSVTTSTDSWATTANQTVATNTSAFNALVRSGISGEIAYIDIANAVDPLALNKWPVSKIIGATSGTANFATADGTHENSAMNTIIAQLLSYTASWIRR